MTRTPGIGHTLSKEFYLRIGFANTRQRNILPSLLLYNRDTTIPIDIKFDLAEIVTSLSKKKRLMLLFQLLSP